jgi:hypothetical protein
MAQVVMNLFKKQEKKHFFFCNFFPKFALSNQVKGLASDQPSIKLSEF